MNKTYLLKLWSTLTTNLNLSWLSYKLLQYSVTLLATGFSALAIASAIYFGAIPTILDCPANALGFAVLAVSGILAMLAIMVRYYKEELIRLGRPVFGNRTIPLIGCFESFIYHIMGTLMLTILFVVIFHYFSGYSHLTQYGYGDPLVTKAMLILQMWYMGSNGIVELYGSIPWLEWLRLTLQTFIIGMAIKHPALELATYAYIALLIMQGGVIIRSVWRFFWDVLFENKNKAIFSSTVKRKAKGKQYLIKSILYVLIFLLLGYLLFLWIAFPPVGPDTSLFQMLYEGHRLVVRKVIRALLSQPSVQVALLSAIILMIWGIKYYDPLALRIWATLHIYHPNVNRYMLRLYILYIGIHLLVFIILGCLSLMQSDFLVHSPLFEIYSALPKLPEMHIDPIFGLGENRDSIFGLHVNYATDPLWNGGVAYSPDESGSSSRTWGEWVTGKPSTGSIRVSPPEFSQTPSGLSGKHLFELHTKCKAFTDDLSRLASDPATTPRTLARAQGRVEGCNVVFEPALRLNASLGLADRANRECSSEPLGHVAVRSALGPVAEAVGDVIRDKAGTPRSNLCPCKGKG